MELKTEERISTKKKVKLRVNATEDSGTDYQFDISFFVFQEGDVQIAYCPSLDLSTSGTDYIDAVKNFYECFQLYIESCLEMGTLTADLKAHGWKVTKKSITPPTARMQLKDKPMIELLEKNVNFQRIVAPVRLSALV
ncbi:MAG: hypothetical protein IJ911_06870 [Salinivirgaceae bacterium]|nr:hypothetical protein [Salinivirgaceae bacterium]